MNAPSNIEDVYRLTELQEAMLVHRLQRGRDETGVLCVRGTLSGELDRDLFADAWRSTLARHAAARSSVHWEDLKHPVQVVGREIDVTLDIEDWSDLPAGQQQARMDGLERSAREQGLDIRRLPVMRWTLAKLSDRKHAFLWVCHHLLLDGWSSSLLLNEVLRRYDGLRDDHPLAEVAAPRFRDWVSWLREHDHVDPAAFWREQPFRASSSLARADWHVDPAPARPETVDRKPSFTGPSLQEYARRREITTASILLGCWALTLAEASDGADPVFGFVASGRGADFDSIESLVGMLSNTLPLAPTIDRAARIEDWFGEIAKAQRAVLRYERCSLGKLLRSGGFAPRGPMFDSMISYANYPNLEQPQNGKERLTLSDFESDVTSNCPLTVAITQASEMRLRAHYQPHALSRADAEGALTRFDEIVSAVVEQEPDRIGDLLSGMSPQHRSERHNQRPPALLPRIRSKAPDRPVEGQLLAIWHTLLKVPEIGLDDNFFDLGGDSILLPQMIDRIRHDFGAELALGAVVECPTVRHLADIIESGAQRQTWRCLVPFRASGNRPPLYLMHGLEGEIRFYQDLANRLPPDQPLFCLQPPAERLTDIAEMASRYLEEVRLHQPHGPYYLGGFCVGGMLAYEMARQLSAAGDEVAPLLLLDCIAPGPLFAMSSTVLPSAGKLIRMLVDNPGHFMHLGTQRISRSVGRIGRPKEETQKPVELDEVRDLSGLPGLYYEPATRHFRAARDYAPEPWDGDAHLLRTVDDRFSDDLGWRKWITGRLSIDYVPGEHMAALKEPHVQDVARKVTTFLNSTSDSKSSRST